ncbi:MAG: hypothetical protein CM15mP120_12130 [Pseudomonadota bacterium]|nr:MAG: hypothetical protein CM15mP120_12130 [Pseudomonadota bacterium]
MSTVFVLARYIDEADEDIPAGTAGFKSSDRNRG